MNKLITIMQPFMAKQSIYVYEDNVKIDVVQTNYENFNNKIIELYKQYNATELEIIGPKQYTKGIGNKILEEEINKYNENKINIIYK